MKLMKDLLPKNLTTAKNGGTPRPPRMPQGGAKQAQAQAGGEGERFERDARPQAGPPTRPASVLLPSSRTTSDSSSKSGVSGMSVRFAEQKSHAPSAFDRALTPEQSLVFRRSVRTQMPRFSPKERVVVWPHGQMYFGPMDAHGRPHGEGMLTGPDGRTQPSTWDAGKLKTVQGKAVPSGSAFKDAEKDGMRMDAGGPKRVGANTPPSSDDSNPSSPSGSSPTDSPIDRDTK